MRLLLIAHHDPSGIASVAENIECLEKNSQHTITALNLFTPQGGPLALPASITLDDYDGIIFHNTAAYNPLNLRSLDLHTREKFHNYGGIKILMKQDENHRFTETAAAMGAIGIDLMFTTLPPKAIPQIYPPNVVGKVTYERMLTGYVTPSLRAIDSLNTDRPIDIGYRGSIQSLSFGRLAYEKRSIGDDVSRALSNSGLKLDISSRREDRIGGGAWIDFLKRCKATLGAESGASVFDLSGELTRRSKKLDESKPEEYLAAIADLENNVHYGQVSPRHFEAAACGTLQLLYPGDYSGIFKPGVHYFPLARDLSNLDEAVALLQNETKRREITERAYRDIIQNPAYAIETFIARFDALVTTTAALKQRAPQTQTTRGADARAAAHNLLVALWRLIPAPLRERCKPLGFQLYRRLILR